MKKNLECFESIYNSIYLIRGKRIILDEDLAKLYNVETKVLNQAVRRNKARFPEEFMFQLTLEEYINLRSQFVTSKRGGRRYTPFVFTEHGTVMLASVLKSDVAIKMNIEIVKAFVQLRYAITSQKDVLKQLSEVRSFMLKQSNKTDLEFKKVWKALDCLTFSDDSGLIGFEID